MTKKASRIPLSPLSVDNSLIHNELGNFLQKNGTKSGQTFSLHDALQELCKEKKMNLFASHVYIDYTIPKLTIGKDWYISYYVKSPETNKLTRQRIKINHIKPISERRKAAKSIIAALTEKLALGWNPFVEAIAVNSYTKLYVALEHFIAVKEKETEFNSIRSYKSFINTFIKWLNKNGFSNDSYCPEFKDLHAIKFSQELELKENISPRTYNNYISFFILLFNWLQEKGYVAKNPFINIHKKRKRDTKKKRRILTDSELYSLFNYLKYANKEYLVLCLLCYSCFLRPKEIALLRCQDIDLKNQLIHIRKEIAKNDNDSYRTIPDEIVAYFKVLDLTKPEYYLFSNNKGYNFKSGDNLLCSRKIAKYWQDILRPKLNFPMELQFYSLKDTGITNMSDLAKVPLNIVRSQADHSDLRMTAIYLGQRPTANEELKKAKILPNLIK